MANLARATMRRAHAKPPRFPACGRRPPRQLRNGGHIYKDGGFAAPQGMRTAEGEAGSGGHSE